MYTQANKSQTNRKPLPALLSLLVIRWSLHIDKIPKNNIHSYSTYYCLYTMSWHRETAILGIFYYKIVTDIEKYSLKHVKIACFAAFSHAISIW